MLIIGTLGNISLAGFQNPALQAIVNIVQPTSFQQSIGNVFSYGLFCVGVWAFRNYLMNYNWRITLVWTNCFNVVNAAITFTIIYDTFGVCQNAWFYVFGTQILQLIVGIAQVLGSLAIVEVSPAGLEATVYELLTTVHNGAITITSVLTERMIGPLDLGGIETPTAYEARKAYYNQQMDYGTWISMGIILVGTFGFMLCQPMNKEQCRQWRDRKAWNVWYVGVINLVLAFGPSSYSIFLTLNTLINP